MYYFCTYFDQHYLTRGLALYHSLRKHCPAFKLWVLCMDHVTYQLLEKLGLPGLHPIALEDFERDDKPLQDAKQTRSRIEYYFTCTPSLPLFVLKSWPNVDLITYLDADLFFFSSPIPLFEELGSGSIAIIRHRFAPHLRRHEATDGIYNVSWVSFRRDKHGLACLHWWRERCIEWCYDRNENGRFADQKYLDDSPSRFQNVVVLEHKGADLALWNVDNHRLRFADDTVMVADQPLVFFHFHGLRQINDWLYAPNWEGYGVAPSMVLRRKIYADYIRALFDMRQSIPASASQSIRTGVRYQVQSGRFAGESMVGRLAEWLRRMAIWGQGLLRGRYILVM